MSDPRCEARAGRTRRRAGMTLVEIMVSLVVLAFGLLGVAALQVRAITESSGGQHLSTASAIARNRVEELMRTDWDAAVMGDSNGVWSTPTSIPDSAPGSALTFARSERIADNDATPANATVKAIEVRVTWTDEKRQNRAVVLTSARLRETDE